MHRYQGHRPSTSVMFMDLPDPFVELMCGPNPLVNHHVDA